MTAIANHRTAPGPRQRWPLPYGMIAEMRRRPLRYYPEMARQYGDVVRFQIGSYVWHLLRHPDHIKHVLQDHQKNYPRSRFFNFMKPVVGEGLVTSEGDVWLGQRRLIQPVFQRQRVAAFGAMMTTAAAGMLKRWQATAVNGQPLDIAAEMMRLTLEIVGRALFTTDISGEADELGRALYVAMEYINHRMNHPFALPLSVPTPFHRRFRKAMRTMDRVVYGMITERRRQTSEAHDLLSMLLAARDEETGQGMADVQVRDQLRTFILAGHETTAMALSWTWYLLSLHPDVDRRLRAEVAAVLGGRTPTIQDLPQLKYTKMVIEESMRIYPPVWAASRDVIADDEIAGFHIPAKSLVILSQYVTHRHPEFWENPEGFDPERFTPERVAARPRYAYFPFLGGPHQCIGNDFAMMEAQLIVASVVQAYRLHLLPGYPVEPDPIFTLRPRHDVMMTVHPA
jgi:cytochrome P450